ncbi:MAG: DUF188 domain-containing protein [Spirochaetaceae bacterium]|nr:DUF188 domain-containing protein [Spirochaetaceae bacterium]
MTVWVDADSCPVRVRQIVAKAAGERKTPAVFVANREVPLPRGAYTKAVVVEKTEGSADAHICENAAPGDLVITRDIPLAADLVRKGVTAINDRGDVFTAETVGERLSLRNFMKDLRDAGLYESSSGTFGAREVRLFSNAFDRELTRLKTGPDIAESILARGKDGIAPGLPPAGPRSGG